MHSSANKAKRQYRLTLQVGRDCILPLQSRAADVLISNTTFYVVNYAIQPIFFTLGTSVFTLDTGFYPLTS